MAAHRALQAADGVVAGLLDGALSTEQKSQLGVSLYDAAPHYRESGRLFGWEERWFADRLPDAPGRILVGACGVGREVVALAEAGHDVHGFEPAGSLLRLAAERAPSATLWSDSYESWLDRNGADRYDAVLLGWGSLSHVLDAQKRRELLQRASDLCPSGPILASYWARSTAPEAARARRLGAAIGARLGSGPTLGDAYLPNIGFVHPFDEAELVGLADDCGRVLRIEGGPSDYPHATFEAKDA